MLCRAGVIAVMLLLPVSASFAAIHFPWLTNPISEQADKIGDIKPMDGYERVAVDSGGYAEWLRALPLKKSGSPLLHYDGRQCAMQSNHYRLLDIDVGDRDLQQCADAVIRLRAEFLYSQKQLEPIRFNFTSGDCASFCRWALGYRPRVRGNDVRWIKQASPDSSYQTFRKYLNSVFTYAGTYSLAKEMTKVPSVARLQPGDVVIRGGFPGHVLMVVDVIRHKRTGQLAVLLAQSLMPAHDIHIVKNVRDRGHSPWFLVSDGAPIRTRYFSFETTDLKRFASH